MIRKKWIDIAAVISISFALLISITLTYFPQVFALETKGVTMQYETRLFDKDAIMAVDILMSDGDWQDMLDNAAAEKYYCCDVIVNGVTYRNVGIRPKGNTSLSQIVSDDTTDRYSFKIEFDHYDSTQTCMGLDKLVLNNMMSDATYRKEYLSYDIMSYLGVETSLYSYASVSRNGENWGLYLALEGMEESYAERVFGSSYGELYKPESLGMGGGENSGQGTDLAYIDDNTDSYSAIFNAAVFEPSQQDKERVVEALKNISEGTDLEDYVDVDSMLRYIASNTFLINDDSYFGNMLHNYYLYEENGKITMLPWDYNLAFGGFQNQNASAIINRGIDDVVSGNLENRPMIARLLEVEQYQTQYYELLDELISGYFESGYFEELMDKLDMLIDSYVADDPTAFYTYEEYTAANEMMRLFCEKRAESVREQLEGMLAKTASEQTSDTKIDATTVTISVMGTQGGGHDMAGGRGEFFQKNGDTGQNIDTQSADVQPADQGAAPQPPEGMQIPEGMGQPEGDKQPPEGMQLPEGSQTNSMFSNNQKQDNGTQNDMQKENFRGANMQNGGFPGGAGGNFPEDFSRADSAQNTADGILWLIISAVVMLAGLLFVRFYPRSRF